MSKSINRRILLGAGAGLPLIGKAVGANISRPPLRMDPARNPDLVIPLWPDGAPGGENVTISEYYEERTNNWGLPDRAARDVTTPTLSVFRPEKPSGRAILIIPGGGYRYIVVEKEGFESAHYLNRMGMTAYVLKHRMPHQGWTAGPDTPLQDAQRAMRIIRSHAKAEGFDAGRISVMGFSAGGHVAGSLSTRFDTPVYDPIDDADALSARPDGTALIYPVASMTQGPAHEGSRNNLIGKDPSPEMVQRYSLEHDPRPDIPPTWLLHASDDTAVPVENSLLVYQAWKAVGIPVSMHIFEDGGHGFGLRGIDDKPVGAWLSLFWQWAASRGLG